MCVSRVLTAAGMALLIGAGVMASAQAKTDEDYDKLMKSVGAANGAMRKATEPAAQAAEAARLVPLFKDAQQFWVGRDNKEAADWAAAAMGHAARIESAATAKDAEGVAAGLKELGAVCSTCHAKYRVKTETGYAIKKS
jgi:cytochrome c556